MSVEEMTGRQALERAAPDKERIPGPAAKREFESLRHGTTTLIGNGDVVQGVMFAETIGPTRTEADFVAHLRRTVATDPEAKWGFVLDNLNVPWSASLVEWIRDVCEPDRDLGKKGKHGDWKNQARRRRFLSDTSHRIRFVFLPKHSSWLNQIEVLFGIVMRKVMRRGNFTSVADLETQLREFLQDFNTTMARPFDWTDTGQPITHEPATTFCPPHRRRRPQNARHQLLST